MDEMGRGSEKCDLGPQMNKISQAALAQAVFWYIPMRQLKILLRSTYDFKSIQ